MVGAGVTADNIGRLMKECNVSWLHGSFSSKFIFQNDIFELGTKFETIEDQVRKAAKSVA